ncbi:unnamed protein product [Allacma fusca]|uniref:Ionotropic glutamate receptor C-terminal domain-containing protein n=1 Tax=Allacma fusca TaxID=39272 RepID=A0A8J2NYL1_9HEXA|nr:unnamed protein product [Allacma fusca]
MFGSAFGPRLFQCVLTILTVSADKVLADTAITPSHYRKCPVKIATRDHSIVPIELFTIIIDVPKMYIAQDTFSNPANKFQNKELIIPNLRTNRFIAHCEILLLFLEGLEFHENQAAQYQLNSFLPFPFNTFPQFTYHVFIGSSEAETKSVLRRNQVQNLGLQTAIVNTGTLFKDLFKLFSEFEALNVNRFSLDLLRNQHFRCEGFPTPVYTIFNQRKEFIGGTSYEFLRNTGNHLNFTFTLKGDGFRNLGQNPNGSWNGFIGDVNGNKVDLAFTLQNTYQRNPYSDFTTHTMYFNTIFFAPLPQVRVKWEAIFYPFTIQVWGCIAVSLFLATLLLYLIQEQSNFEGHSGNQLEHLYQAVIIPISIFLQQNCSPPRNMRFFTGIFLFYAIIMGTCFNCNLISFLTFPETDPVPSTPEELSSMKNFRAEIIYYPGASCDHLFRTSTHPTYTTIAKKLERVPLRNINESYVRTAMKDNQVTIDYDVSAILMSAKTLTIYENFDTLTMSRKPMLFLPMSIVLKKYSKHTSGFSQAIGMLASTGHYQHWFRNIIKVMKQHSMRNMKYLRNRGDQLYIKLNQIAYNHLNASNVQASSLDHFVVCFFLLLIGWLVSGVCFTFEIIRFYIHNVHLSQWKEICEGVSYELLKFCFPCAYRKMSPVLKNEFIFVFPVESYTTR